MKAWRMAVPLRIYKPGGRPQSTFFTQPHASIALFPSIDMNCHPPSSLYRTIRLDVYEGGQLIFTNKGKGHHVLYITYSGEIETTIPGVSFDKELLEGLFTLSRKEGFTARNEKIQKLERETQMGRL